MSNIQCRLNGLADGIVAEIRAGGMALALALIHSDRKAVVAGEFERIDLAVTHPKVR
jgi:hypothetical protein